MIRIALIGSTGKMGAAVKQVAQTELPDKIEITCEVSLEKPVLNLKNIDCVISFASPTADLQYICEALSAKVPCVVGTTGFTSEQIALFEREVQKNQTSIVLSSNFSPLVNTQVYLAGIAAKLLTPLGYEIGIVDEHHSQKKDAPSGTTRMLAQEIKLNSNYTRENYWLDEKRDKQKHELDVGVMRIGGTPGIHEVRISGKHGRMQIETCMFDRLEFARGALQSVLFLYSLREEKTRKIYNFREVMGI